MEWPAQSPDINPIENLWAELNRVTNDRKPNNKEVLKEVLKDGWQLITEDYIHKLIESMPHRCM